MLTLMIVFKAVASALSICLKPERDIFSKYRSADLLQEADEDLRTFVGEMSHGVAMTTVITKDDKSKSIFTLIEIKSVNDAVPYDTSPGRVNARCVHTGTRQQSSFSSVLAIQSTVTLAFSVNHVDFSGGNRRRKKTS